MCPYYIFIFHLTKALLSSCLVCDYFGEKVLLPDPKRSPLLQMSLRYYSLYFLVFFFSKKHPRTYLIWSSVVLCRCCHLISQLFWLCWQQFFYLSQSVGAQINTQNSHTEENRTAFMRLCFISVNVCSENISQISLGFFEVGVHMGLSASRCSLHSFL